MAHEFEKYADEYRDLWASMEITRPAAVADAARLVIRGRERYEELEKQLGIPWQFIGALHLRESSCNFRTHLHNGDSLSQRTRHEPAGRPKFPPSGSNGYTWVESAVDALKLKKLDEITDWSIERICYEGERFNGFGYRFRGRPRSPYLWSGTNHYTKGKFVSDGRYSSSTVDVQVGIMPVIKKVDEITNARVVPGSRSQWYTKFYKWAFPVGGGLSAIMSQFVDFITNWETAVVLVLAAVITAVGFYTVEQYRLNEYREGRYMPSSDKEDLDELA